MRLPCFNIYYDMFYPSGKKIVPLNIYDSFTRVSLAYFIMCDGSKHNKGLHLNVYAFDMDSVNRLTIVLKQKYELECTIHQHKSGPRIYISKNSMIKVRELVKPYMTVDMLYKIES